MPDSRATFTTFESDLSVYEYDLVIWDPFSTFVRFAKSTGSRFQGVPSLGEHHSAAFVNAFERRTKEFDEFVRMGRVLTVMAVSPCELAVDSGERSYSGTGRNRQATRYMRNIDLTKAVPGGARVVTAAGEAVKAIDPEFGEVIRGAPDLWAYRAIVAESSGDVLATVTGTDKAVAVAEKFENEGRLVLLPEYLSAINGNSIVPSEADSLDINAEPFTDTDRATTSALLDWLVHLNSQDLDKLPAWAHTIVPHVESPLRTRLAELEEQAGKLAEERSEIQRHIQARRSWWTLFTGTGVALERQVQHAFAVLGFEILPTEEVGRRDLRIRLGDAYGVVEVKGVNKSATEGNAAQLEKWTAEARIEHSIPHKGILVVNSWRQRPPGDREATFPDQMLAYSNSRDHCLVTGLQLYLMVMAALQDGEVARGAAIEIMGTVGPIPGWDDLSGEFSAEDLENVDR